MINHYIILSDAWAISCRIALHYTFDGKIDGTQFRADVKRIMQSFEIYFMLILFDAGDGGALTFVYSFLILSFTSLFANLLFFMPLQLGGREGGFAMSVAQMGMTSDIGMFVSIICRVRELVWTAIGLLLMKVGNKVTDTETPSDVEKED